MKRVTLLVLLAVFSVTLSQAEEALPQQTVSIQDLVLAIQMETIKDYVGKDLTVIGIGMLMITGAAKLDGQIDDKPDNRVAFTPFNVEVPSGNINREVAFFIPVTTAAAHPILKQSLLNRLTIAHVHLGLHKQFLTKDLYLFMPLDTFDVLDSQTPASTAATPGQ